MNDVREAVARGYPTASQRKLWNQEQWDMFNERIDARDRAIREQYDEEYAQSNGRLLERINELEFQLMKLTTRVTNLDGIEP